MFSFKQQQDFSLQNNNIPSFRMRLQASLDSASIAVTSPSVKFIVCQTATSSERRFWLRSGRSSLSARAFASTPMLSVPLGAGSSILLSFAGDASPSVDLLALRCHLLLKFYRSPAALARRNSTDPSLSVLRSLPSFTGRARNCLDGTCDVSLRCRYSTNKHTIYYGSSIEVGWYDTQTLKTTTELTCT